MKQLMIIPLSFIGLLSLGHSTVPVQSPVNPSWSVIGDTTIPRSHGNHAMKGNGTDTTGNSQGKWEGKGKHHSKGAHNDGTGTSTNATGTANPATGTGAGASTGTSTNK